jgi:hypothetical protein
MLNGSRLERIFWGMHDRCENPSSNSYADYGARGIKVEPEWTDYSPFEAWALQSGYSDNLSIDRIDVNGNYGPENCRWATMEEQLANRRGPGILPPAQTPGAPAQTAGPGVSPTAGMAEPTNTEARQKPDTQQITNKALQDITRANNYFRDYVEQDLIERYNVYYSSKERYKQLYPETSELSETRTFDLWSTCEWLLPDLLQAFFGSDRIINISGRDSEDSQRAEVFMKLIQWQLTVKNQGYRIFKGWFGDALATNMGVLKCYWKREQKQVPGQAVLNNEQLLGLMQNPNIQIQQTQPTNDINAALGMAPPTANVSWIENVTTVNQPVIELIKPSDLRFVPDGRTLGECSMVAHRKLVTIDYLRREAQRGLFDPNVVEEIAETATDYQDPSELEIILNNASRESTQHADQDQARTRVILYECYSKLDINGDGLLEDVIINICNKKMLRIVENPWGRAPLFELIPFWDNYQVWSKVGLAEIVKDTQDTHTALLRQMIYALGVSNQVHGVVDTSTINVQDLIDGSQYIRSKGPVGPQAFQQLQLAGLNPQNFQMFEYIKAQLEQWTPITRYNQGSDGQSLNKTATGISMIMSSSQRRQEEIARNFAETGISELYRFLIKLNQHYMDQATVIRLQNEQMPVTPDDLQGEYDLAVDATSGLASKQSKMETLSTYLREGVQLGMQFGIVGPEQVILAAEKLMKLGGIEDAERYFIHPDPMAMQMQMMQMQQAQMISQGGAIPGVPNPSAKGAIAGDPVPQGTEGGGQQSGPPGA